MTTAARSTRSLALATLFALTLVGGWLTTPTASARSVTVSATIEVEERPLPDNRCFIVAFVRFADVPKATSYDIRVYDGYYDGVFFHGGQPDFDDGYAVLAAPGLVVALPPPGGQHQSFLSSFGGPAAQCPPVEANYYTRFVVVSAQATVPDDRHRISGHVLDTSGKPVAGAAVTATGAGTSGSAATGADGSYSIEVDDGAYTVSPALAGMRFEPASRVVDVRADVGGVDFVGSGVFRVTGRVTACPADARCPAPVPVPNVTVRATGSDTATAISREDGSYVLELAKGSYTLTPALNDATFDPVSRGVKVGGDVADVDFKTCTEGTGEFVNCSSLQVTVKAKPSPVVVEQTVEGTVKEPVEITVVVKNRGTQPMHNVTIDPQLVIGYTNGAKTDSLPLRLKPGKGKEAAKPVKLGTLRPGASTRPTVLHYEARGDGDLDVRALVTYSLQPRSATLAASGVTTLALQSKLLVISTSFPAKLRVRSPETTALVKAGTNFAIRVKIENRSFTKPLFVQPLGFRVAGNAHGGKWQPSGLPIQTALAGTGEIAQCTCHEAIRLAPRTEQVYDVVFASWGNDPRARNVAPGRRGTRAELKLLDFGVWIDPEDDQVVPAPVDAKRILIDPDSRKYSIHLDDSPAAKAPFSPTVAAAYFTAGAFQGLWDWTAGTVSGVFVDLPQLVLQGALNLPSNARKYTQLQVELWNSLDGPGKLAYLDVVHNQFLLAYKNSPALAKEAEKLWGGINQSVEKKYTAMANEWYDGDWVTASQQFGNEGAQRFADVASALAPCVLARFPRAVEALKAARTLAYERIGATLAATSARLRGSQALQALAQITRTGFEFSDPLLRQLYGLTDDQIRFLRDFSQTNKVLITLRTRGYDALRWGEAFFKPEQIKIKTVSWIDAEYLGYGDDIGRVVIREPIDQAQVIRHLAADGHVPGSARYQEVLDRLKLRTDEWFSKEPGMVQDLQRAKKKGVIELEWNWKENLIDPSATVNEKTTAGLRMRSTGRTVRNPTTGKLEPLREWVLEIDPDFTGAWKSVVGDLDIVALTDLAGRGISDGLHKTLFRILRASPLKSPHAESASWTKNGKFWFQKKAEQLARTSPISGEQLMDVQFGGDGVPRAVTIDLQKSDLIGPNINGSNYTIFADGGYTLPAP